MHIAVGEKTTTVVTPDEQAKVKTARIRELLQNILISFFTSRIILFAIGIFAILYIQPLIGHAIGPAFPPATSLHHKLLLMWKRFDSGFYLDIAMHGYWGASTLHTYSDWAFFPFFPLLIKPVALLLGGSANAVDLAGFLVANACILLAIIYGYFLVKRDFGEAAATRTILLLSAYPLSFFFSAIYSESTFILCIIACLYYTRRHSWWLACLFGAAASLTRAEGIVLVLPVAWEMIHQAHQETPKPLEQKTSKLLEQAKNNLTSVEVKVLEKIEASVRVVLRVVSNRKSLLTFCWLLLIPAGIGLFMVYGQIKTGDYLATFHNEQWGWGRQLGNPIQLIQSSLQSWSLNPMDWNFWLLNMVCFVIFTGSIFVAIRYKMPVTYILALAIMVLFPLCSSRLNSLGRYYVVIFPFYIVIALWSLRGNTSRRTTLLLSTFYAFQALLFLLFVISAPAIA